MLRFAFSLLCVLVGLTYHAATKFAATAAWLALTVALSYSVAVLLMPAFRWIQTCSIF